MRDFLPTFPQICLFNGNLFFWQHNSVSVSVLNCRKTRCLSAIILDTTICDPSIPPEQFFGAGLQMSSRVEKRAKKWNSFSTCLTLFSTLPLAFWTPGPEGPGTQFKLHFQRWARRAQQLLCAIKTPCDLRFSRVIRGK